jgi:hypothetical protein
VSSRCGQSGDRELATDTSFGSTRNTGWLGRLVLWAVTELLDDDTARRVLRRAIDLADAAEPVDDHRGVSEDTLVEAAVEVGIPAAAVRRAAAVERLDARPQQHAGDRVVGVGIVTVDAEVRGSPDEVLARLDAWFVDGHHLRRDRLRGGRGVWTKRTGVVGRAVRTVRVATGEGRLGRARCVSVSTSATGVGTTVVRVQVDRSHGRRSAAAAGAVVAGVTAAGTVLIALVTAPVVVAATPVALVAGAGVARRGRSGADDIAHEVGRVLDAVDDRIAPTRLRIDIARRAIGRPGGAVVRS